MRLTWVYRGSQETLQANERRAALVWSHFFDLCSKTPSKYVLDSSKVGTILTGDEGESPYRQTVSRVMELVAELGKKYVELRTIDDRNSLVIDRAAFDAYVEELSTEVAAGMRRHTVVTVQPRVTVTPPLLRGGKPPPQLD